MFILAEESQVQLNLFRELVYSGKHIVFAACRNSRGAAIMHPDSITNTKTNTIAKSITNHEASVNMAMPYRTGIMYVTSLPMLCILIVGVVEHVGAL